MSLFTLQNYITHEKEEPMKTQMDLLGNTSQGYGFWRHYIYIEPQLCLQYLI